MFGPSVKSVVLPVSLIVIPVVLFEVFMSKELVIEFQQPFGNLIITMAVIFEHYVSSFLVSNFYILSIYIGWSIAFPYKNIKS